MDMGTIVIEKEFFRFQQEKYQHTCACANPAPG
jgi:hypothetical protein